MKKFAVITLFSSLLIALVSIGRVYSESKQEPNYRIIISETKFDPALNGFGVTSEYFLCQNWNLVVEQVYNTKPRTSEGGSLPHAEIRQATMVISFPSPDPTALKTRKLGHGMSVQLEEGGVSRELVVEDLHTSKTIFHYKSGETSIFQ